MKYSKLVMLVFLLPALLLAGCNQQVDENIILAQKIIDANLEKYEEIPYSGEVIDGVRVIEIKAYQFNFVPEVIKVAPGEKVKLIVHAEDVPHGFEIEGFEIPGYDINTIIRPGLPLEIEFVADEVGIWDFICTIYCGFGHSQMKGLFIIG